MKPASKGSNRVPRKSLRLQLGMALALTTTALGVQAAGLGRLNLLSGIGQPLRAEIELTSVSRDEAASLTARLANVDAFNQAGIEYGAAMSGLRFSIQRRASGQPYVLVTSSQLVNDPFLDVLVELSWSSGRLVREYTLLLDPPDSKPARSEIDPGATIVPAQTAPTIVTRAPRAPAAPSPAVSSSSTASPPSAARPAAGPATSPAAGGTSSGDYVVQSGDTAISIARANKADAVSLDQMLAALYRDNPKAFGGNVNRLMAGATLKIPDAATAQAVDAGEARRVVAESANFGSYRDRIARNAADASTARSTGQQASGQLSTQVDDRSAPSSETKDRLQLSRPDAVRSATGATGSRSGVGGPSVDELAAKDRELQETRTRLALLEKNVADLQELLKLKNQTLADLQKGAAIKPADTPAPAAAVVTPPAPAVSTPPPAASTSSAPAPVVATPPAPMPAPPPASTPATTASAPAAATPPTAAPVKAAPAAPATETGFIDSLLDNTLLLVGLVAIVLLLIGYGIFTARRRRKLARFEDSIFVDNSVLHANSVFGTTGGQSVDTANSGFHSNFVPVAGNLPEQSEVDPVAEADVYIAYGRDAQAEEILKEALRADGTRHAVRLKLLEIYAKRGDAKTFETMASELYAATGGQGEDWKQAATLGASIDPRNPLYSESAISDAPAASPASPSPAVANDRAAAFVPSLIGEGLAAGTLASASMGLAPAFDIGTTRAPEDREATAKEAREMARTDPMPRSTSNEPTSTPSMDLDFDLGNAGVAPLRAAASAPASEAAPVEDYNASQATKLIDPFTASAFGANDPTARTAVNLPAFRARADGPEPAATPRADADGFTASDIFGSSIVGDTLPMYSEPAAAPAPPPPSRTTDLRHALDSHQFDKTEPLDAFSKINLDLEDSGYTASDAKSDFGTKTDVWQAMATKLDLALAYSDIGDKDGARELLEEVVRNGDQVQAERARHLIGELG